ncbi:MAG: DUF2807 domain-containing protein [Chloroflexi bacterium]|nr:DUF2807 domain-containing protein [Chloroflexota bacterium]
MVTRNSTVYQGAIEGSDRLVTRTFAVRDFDSLDISSSFQATIYQANRFEVQVTADDNLVPYLQVRKEGGALSVGLRNGTSIENAHLKVHIIMPRLASVTLSGACRGMMRGFHGDDLHAVVSGASQLTGDIDAPHTTFEASGASTVSLTGNAPNAILGASGASQLLLDGCSIQTADVTLSGASQARLNVQQTLNYDLTGASQLRYRGEPTMQTTSVTGASSVTKE